LQNPVVSPSVVFVEQLNVIIIHRGAPPFRSGNLIFSRAFGQNWKYRNFSQIDEWQRTRE
jgi:hypothetical protein